MLPSSLRARFPGDGGTISAIGFPKRVMRIGLRFAHLVQYASAVGLEFGDRDFFHFVYFMLI